MIGLSGLKLWKRQNVFPIFLTANHDTWKESIQELIKSAKLIVIDTTTQSSAIDWEINELVKNNRLPDTILIQEETNEIKMREHGARKLIVYRKSWLQAIPRILIGFIISALAAIGWVSLTPLLSLIPNIDSTVAIVLYLGGAYVLAPILAFIPLFLWYTYPVMKQKSRKELEEIFRNVSSGTE